MLRRSDLHNYPQNMLAYESALYQRGYQFIAGVDEAGRGALAGPVVAAAVILSKNISIPGLTDSKQLSASQRETFYAKIQRLASAVGIGIVSNVDIDHVNILQATLQAMNIAISTLAPQPDYILIDGTHAPALVIPHSTIPKGDSRSLSIAAASVIAKVTRDRLMCDLHRIYPHYGFDQHKGYPTRRHKAKIAHYGSCAIHRRSFRLG